MRDSEAAQSGTPVLTRALLQDQLRARLEGRLTAESLAAWAFDRFYEHDIGELELEMGAEDEIQDVLDHLMFADDAAFALDTAALDALLRRLGL